jgi:hypothetical protein
VRSPIDQDWLLGRFVEASAQDVDRAVQAAARAAYPAWAATPWRDRVALLRRAARLIEERVYAISAAVALEVGKNRMESLGEVQETADLIDWYCDQMEANEGFDRALPDDPLPHFRSHNRTVLRPYGVWAVIAPFNFPFALAGGPMGPALDCRQHGGVQGVADTSLSGRLLLMCCTTPVCPPGSSTSSPVRATTSAGAGRASGRCRHHLHRLARGGHAGAAQFACGPPPAAVHRRDGRQERGDRQPPRRPGARGPGIVRSAFGLSGQKCSACSRVYVERRWRDALRERMARLTEAICRWATRREQRALDGPGDRPRRLRALRATAPSTCARVGRRSTPAAVLDHGVLARGFFVAPLADDAAAEGQHADDEDRAHDHRDPGADLVGQVVLHRDDDGGADHRAEQRAHAAQQRHQHHLAGHVPVHVGQRGELEHQRLGGAGQAGQRRPTARRPAACTCRCRSRARWRAARSRGSP